MRNIRQEHVNTQDSGISFMQRLGQDINIPSSWDWRTHGAVTPVINQGQSGAVESYVAAGIVLFLYKSHCSLRFHTCIVLLIVMHSVENMRFGG